MSNFEVKQWVDISDSYKGAALLIGNGASISLDDSFSYRSLLEELKDICSDPALNLFEIMNTVDFEEVLHALSQAKTVNDVMGIKDDLTPKSYETVRNNLIKVVRKIHPDYADFSSCFGGPLDNINTFIKQFSVILSLNYDLILYWSIMWRQYQMFDDCFRMGGVFELSNWFSKESDKTYIFYPHGNLVIGQNRLTGQELKISVRGSDNLILEILRMWEKDQYSPVFISEGTTAQKVKSINNSFYLKSVYDFVLPMLGVDKLVIYGWSLSDNDNHILKQLKENRLSHVAVSIYTKGRDINSIQNTCSDIENKIYKMLGRSIHIDFFDSSSRSCWNTYPEGQAPAEIVETLKSRLDLKKII